MCVVDEDIDEHLSPDRILRDTTHHRLPPRYRAFDHSSLSMSTQLIPYPLTSPSMKSMTLEFEHKDVIEGHIEGLTEV